MKMQGNFQLKKCSFVLYCVWDDSVGAEETSRIMGRGRIPLRQICRHRASALNRNGEECMTYEEAVKTIPCGRYRHFKGNPYEVVGIARHSETVEPMVVYRALYGEGGLWCRPASMWNETVERGGKTYKRFYRQDRIDRVEKYERLFEEAVRTHDPETLRLLERYYTEGEWREDYEADERGELPPDLKRGVLSQDALYDLLEENGL